MMSAYTGIAALLFGVILIVVPTGLLIVAVIQMFRTRLGMPTILIAIGGVLLALKSLDFIFTIAVTSFGAEQLAAYALGAVYVFKVVNFFALMLIATGMLQLANRLNSLEAAASARA